VTLSDEQRMRRVQGSLRRSLATLTIGHQRVREERTQMLQPFAGSNMIQCRQVPIAGKVKDRMIAREFNVDWDHPIVSNAARADADNERPHFTHGVELLSPTHVMILVQLVGWIDSDEGWTEGATIRVTAWVPNAKKKHPFEAVLHLAFAGYGVPLEDDPSEDEESEPES
jgi:hypothetical protein